MMAESTFVYKVLAVYGLYILQKMTKEPAAQKRIFYVAFIDLHAI